MNKSINKGLCLLLIQCACIAATQAASPAAEEKASVDKITIKINNLTKTLNKNKAQLRGARDDLLQSERRIATGKSAMASINKKITQAEREIITLNVRVRESQEKQKTNRAALQALMLSRYKNGQANYLKLLLNQQNPYAVGRVANYSDYFSKAIGKRLSALETEVRQANQLNEQHQIALSELASEREEQRALQIKQAAAQQKRKKIVAALDKEITQSNTKLAQLKEDRTRLDRLIKQIAEQAAELKRAEQKRRAREAKIAAEKNRPPPVHRAPVQGGFVKQKGRLHYPSKGTRARTFGSRIASSGMASDGVFFNTQQSAPVTAIFRGRVLFADFLKGYGLLLIIDHGDDHISLYGHNEVLYKSVGDVVETDELISRSGVTGGLKSPGLYFEIRHNATPVNPSKWCQQ